GISRPSPLFVRVGDRGVPAFGLALAAAFASVDAGRIPVDRDGSMVAPSSRQALPRGLKVVPFADIWTAIDERQQDALQRLVADRIVLLLVEPKSGGDRIVVQAHLLDRLLAGAWLRETPAAWTVLGSLVLSGLAAPRAAVGRSTGGEEALRAELAAARAQGEQTRARLDELERRAKTLTAGELREAPLGDAEQERLQRECERLGIVTHDPAMLALFRDLEKAARSSLPIVIAGEPGTGKELFARAAHRLSPRADGPFVAVNT